MCHCQCGLAPTKAHTTRTKDRASKGEPYIWVAGHQPRPLTGGYTKQGVPVEKIRPLLDWLHTLYGNWVAVAEITGVSHGTVKAILNDNKRTSPATAKKVVDTVLAHKRHGTNAFNSYEEGGQPRFATEQERTTRDEEITILRSEKRRYGY